MKTSAQRFKRFILKLLLLFKLRIVALSDSVRKQNVSFIQTGYPYPYDDTDCNFDILPNPAAVDWVVGQQTNHG
jgi:hypothetical protein